MVRRPGTSVPTHAQDTLYGFAEPQAPSGVTSVEAPRQPAVHGRPRDHRRSAEPDRRRRGERSVTRRSTVRGGSEGPSPAASLTSWLSTLYADGDLFHVVTFLTRRPSLNDPRDAWDVVLGDAEARRVAPWALSLCGLDRSVAELVAGCTMVRARPAGCKKLLRRRARALETLSQRASARARRRERAVLLVERRGGA